MTGPFKAVDYNRWRESALRDYLGARCWNDYAPYLRFPTELRRWSREPGGAYGLIVQTGDAEYRIVVSDGIPTRATHRVPYQDAANRYSSFIAAREAAEYLMESPAPFRDEITGDWREYGHHVHARRTPEQNILVVFPAFSWRLYDETISTSRLPIPRWHGWGRGDDLDEAMRQADASNLTHWRAPVKGSVTEIHHSFFSLVPARRQVTTFRVNSIAYTALVKSCRELCGEVFAGIRLLAPPGKSEADYPDYWRTWWINDQQRVSATDARALGRALAEAIARGEADECVRRQYVAAAAGRLPTPLVSPDPEGDVRELRAKLTEFAGFLGSCGGFAIW